MLGAQAFYQAEQQNPAPVLGYFDLAARYFLRKLIPDEYIACTLPWSLFLKMEEHAEYVLESCVWTELKGSAGAPSVKG